MTIIFFAWVGSSATAGPEEFESKHRDLSALGTLQMLSHSCVAKLTSRDLLFWIILEHIQVFALYYRVGLPTRHDI